MQKVSPKKPKKDAASPAKTPKQFQFRPKRRVRNYKAKPKGSWPESPTKKAMKDAHPEPLQVHVKNGSRDKNRNERNKRWEATQERFRYKRCGRR